MPPLRTPLYDTHVAAGAAMTEFGGWEMPLRYGAIVDEHLAVRRGVGLFDVSHMGKILVEGPTAHALLLGLSTNDLPDREGRARYTHLVDAGGRILDDVIVTCLAPDRFWVVCNAGPRERVLAWIREHASGETVRDLTFDHLCLALQGPRAARVLQLLTPVELEPLKPFRAAWCDLLLSDRLGTGRESGAPMEAKGWGPLAPEREGDGCLVTRTGYTGEDGFELFPKGDLATVVWRALLAAGKDADVRPIGLAARDTLRLEKGFLLSGTDFDGGQTPLEAASERIVKWDHDFVGRDALRRQKERGTHDRLVGLLVDDRGVPRHGHEVVQGERTVGTVTSGTMSPSLKRGIALARVRPEAAPEGTQLGVVVRDRTLRAVVTKPPFV